MTTIDPPANPPDLRGYVEELAAARERVLEGPSASASRQQAERGKLTARARLDLLFDPGSFREIEGFRRHRAVGFGLEERRPWTDGVITGWGTVFGRTVFAYAHDFRVFGGSLGEAHAQKIHKVMDLAKSAGAPLVSLSDGAGARIQEGVTALAGYGGIFRRNVRASGVIPQISVILGPCAGGATYSPALTDFVFMVRGIAQMYITGPEVVHSVTGEDISHERLGGADVHGEVSGAAGFVYDTEEDCLADVRHLLSMLPSNNRELAPVAATGDSPIRRCASLVDLVPGDPSRAYDMRAVIEEIVDDGEMFEVHASWAQNILCGFARLDGHLVGIVANQPAWLAGVLDIHASEKAARFVSTCDAFSIPLVTLVDVPGFLPGRDQEHGGIIRHGAKLLYAYCDATVPRVQLIVRKAYGGAYIVMDSQSIGADLSFAWPSNEIAVMGAEGAANVVFRREIAEAADPEAARAHWIKEYRSQLVHPLYAAERGLVEDVIDPADTRTVLIESLGMLRAKQAPLPDRKHGNPPS
ncbi:methylmalonyl-CoA carboxyltransferase [Prauserella marina]|uniref:Acetyl-CoA carboxylase, carboxyltransferase component n=1 Tax=Prauserella marina TaxID=530584 RepID=A0A222VM32_9PSEU|nr:acyl-CoA carboxylase subunit beta [Prauserella marina]ASR34902.1 methylmalonyl-CoA carboxyltransferase [Prauserella marina]PWV85392.1 acetyl-CoA carboxylase carboxyltransferase subunit beta /acetyl-CoA carboxylase carboxyltransferase subunit alpha [Prauserella marina]SDC55921.1 Acetyl-CoA carboxylase, carboxyltransferase component [Prauserella marina]